MSYEKVIWYITILAGAILVLVLLTNIITEVMKKIINKENYPAQAVVFIIAEILTMVTMGIVCSILTIPIVWYFWILAFIVGILVTYGAIFGYDNLYKQIFTAVINLVNTIFNRGEKNG